MKALILGAATAALLAGAAQAAAPQDKPNEGRPAPAARPAQAAPAARPNPGPGSAPSAGPRPGGGDGGFRGGGFRPGGGPGMGQARPDFGGARPAPGAQAGTQPALAGRPDGARYGGQRPDGQTFQGRRFDGQGFPGRGPAAQPQAAVTSAAPGVVAPGAPNRGVRDGDRRGPGQGYGQGFRGDAGRPGVDRNGDGRIDRGDRRYGGDDRTNFRGGPGGWNGNGVRDGRYGGGPNGRGFSYHGERYRAFHADPFRFPRGYAYRRYDRGYRLPFVFLAPSFYLYDYSSFYLSPPPSAVYRWVRYGPDALLVDTRTGEVIDAAYGVFYDGSTYGDAYGYEDGYGGGYDQGGDAYPQSGPPDGYGDDPR